MTLARCRGTTKDGKPCAAQPRPGTDRCPWHSPDLAQRRAEWSARGGKASSNAARARKALPDGLMSAQELQGVLGTAITDVKAGTLEPGPANAIAALSRAYVALFVPVNFEDRLAALERDDRGSA